MNTEFWKNVYARVAEGTLDLSTFLDYVQGEMAAYQVMNEALREELRRTYRILAVE